MNLNSRENIIKHLNEMEPFSKDDNGEWYLPSIPKMESDDYKEYVVKNFIRCGAIPKKDLIEGRTYLGDCRNSGRAKWNGKDFEYLRHKFGTAYIEHINHFEDDDGFDLFVPMEIEEENC